MNQCAHLHSQPTACSWSPRETLHRHDSGETQTQTGRVGGSGKRRHWRRSAGGPAGSHLPGCPGDVAPCQARKAESLLPKSRDAVRRTRRAGRQGSRLTAGWRPLEGELQSPGSSGVGASKPGSRDTPRDKTGECSEGSQLPGGYPDPGAGAGRSWRRTLTETRSRDVGVEGDAVRS